MTPVRRLVISFAATDLETHAPVQQDLFLMDRLLCEKAKLRRTHLWHSSSSKGATRSAGFVVTISRQTAINTPSLIYRKFKLPLDHRRLTDPKAPAEFSRTARRAADVIGVALAEPGSPKKTRDR